MPVSEKTYEQVALEDPEGQWELVCGRLRSKPPMTHAHNTVGFELAAMLHAQLDREQFEVKFNAGRTRVSDEVSYIPDVIVVPRSATTDLRMRKDRLESYSGPLPLVVEVWSPSTGDYDVDTKLPGYRERGDLEIWRIEPYEQKLTSWARRNDATYVEHTFHAGKVQPVALPGVEIDLDALFKTLE
ncbi:MAG TPA: Uma2 family endonuclease [Tepidiformaceae bacterium]|nr:Uma2 family endonuclease [Tepidiformaceae bacterium]